MHVLYRFLDADDERHLVEKELVRVLIPKKIHYCWFGGNPKPKKVEKCISSWQEKCPDYEIVEWNETNFDISLNAYYRWCYQNEKWAYLSDLARLDLVYHHGGIYLDTDVELVRSLDPLLDYSAFFCFETAEYVASGLGFGAEAQNPIVLRMIEEYSQFEEADQITPVGCPILNTQALQKLGLILNGEFQTIGDSVILPKEYFNPYDDSTGRLLKTSNTYGIHWYFKSALPKSSVCKSMITRPFHRIFGVNCFNWLKHMVGKD